MKNIKLQELQNQTTWINELLSINDNVQIFVVGGYVRDMLLGVKSNDIDLLVTGLTHSQIETVISKHGKLTETDGHFKTIKFKSFNWSDDLDDIDIVIPREDIAMTNEEFKIAKLTNPSLNRHHAFNIVSNPNMSAVSDLNRRDLTINSISMNIITGEMLDPFNGQQDLMDGVIKMTNEKTFVEDPVRMIRALRFANRFGFNIDKSTSNAIKKHSHLINTMSKERLLSELKKTFKANGNLLDFFKEFEDFGFQHHFFNTETQFGLEHKLIEQVRFSEFIFILMGKQLDSSKTFMKTIKGDNDTAIKLKAIQVGVETKNISARHTAFFMFKLKPNMFNSHLFSLDINLALNELRTESFTSVNDLAVGGNELKELLGINDKNIKQRGREIGKMQKRLVDGILKTTLKNNKENIINLIKQ